MFQLSLTPAKPVCIIAAETLSGQRVETLGYVSVEHAIKHLRSCGWKALYVVRPKKEVIEKT